MGQFAGYKLHTFRQPLAVYLLFMNKKTNSKIRPLWLSLPNKFCVLEELTASNVWVYGAILSEQQRIGHHKSVIYLPGLKSLRAAYMKPISLTAITPPDSAELQQFCQHTKHTGNAPVCGSIHRNVRTDCACSVKPSKPFRLHLIMYIGTIFEKQSR